jgi:hypothetical protein
LPVILSEAKNPRFCFCICLAFAFASAALASAVAVVFAFLSVIEGGSAVRLTLQSLRTNQCHAVIHLPLS